MYIAVPWQWELPPHGSVIIKDEVITINQDAPGTGTGKRESYNPFEITNLPNRLAKVEDRKGALEFVQEYGLLGYANLLPQNDANIAFGIYERDPISWFLAQANTIRFVMHLLRLTQEKEEKHILSFMEEQTMKVPEITIHPYYEIGPEQLIAVHLFAEGAETVITPFYSHYGKGEYHLLALQTVSHLINVNTAGVRRRFVIDAKKPRFTTQLSANALIEVIWYLVGNAALISQEGNGKSIKNCKECNLPFIATDRRQQFCPPSAVPGKRQQSLCGAKWRMRKFREPQ